MLDLIQEYDEALRCVEKMRERAEEEDKPIWGSMASDLRYAIQWMMTGRQPGTRRGVERLAAYQKEKSFDPLIMQKFFRSTCDSYYWTEDGNQENAITEWDKNRIEDALSVLTEREKEVYLMSRGQMLSYEDIAKLLCVSKSTIQTTIERAENKIRKQISQSLFFSTG
ncbi:sigma-70 family RNA polymerase sigma factor [Halalkalibacterium halodurans]|uniref:sigma-70 family RNA polymerase sigma factor n=1 Tax=Halalkalibacterium halodurans TaxID=86665 RepID=UPI002E243DA8|nr:sigma-70 family RNA polymerase sigma factor [Halalkalibacterium halodurans]MED4172356.1 sigma-70 family RNA polymerase sigma factor [Halalkalibacterium halodurans]